MMRLRGLVLFLLCVASGARRSVRISDSLHDANQKIETFTKSREVSADARKTSFPRGLRKALHRRGDPQDRGAGVVVRSDDSAELPVDAAMMAEALEGMHLMLEELTGSPTKLQRWLQNSDMVQELAKEHPEVVTLMTDKDQLGPMRELLNGVKRMVEQQHELLREPQEARAAAAEMTDVLAKAEDLVRLVQRVMVEQDVKQDAKIKAATILEAFAPKAEGFQVPGAAWGPRGSARKTKADARTVPATMQDGASMQNLKTLAKELNPAIGYWDPLNLAGWDFFGQGDDATVGFLRHAELKHGRIAMAAFVGYIVQSNGIIFPGKATLGGLTFEDISNAGGPADQWDALPTAGKLQILLFVGFMEHVSEASSVNLPGGPDKHYMRGGKPGAFPSLKKLGVRGSNLRFPLDLFDPFNLQKKMTPEEKAVSLRAEINNGRLAMLGIMAFLAEAKVPGSVPALTSLGLKPYSGEIMAPFAAGDANLPLVQEMLKLDVGKYFGPEAWVN